MKRSGSRASLLFRLIVPAAVLFILTVLAMIGALFGNNRAPLSQWLDRYAGRLLVAEFVLIIALTVLAMMVDRIRTLRSIRSDTACANPPPAETASDSSASEE